MSDTQSTSITPAAILQRTALPFFLFSLVLTTLLMITKMTVLPALLSVDIDGTTRNVQDLKTYHDVLAEQIAKKVDQRNTLILPMEGTDYRSLADWKQEQYSFSFLTSSLSQLAKAVPATEGGTAVYVESIRYYPIDKMVEMRGDVRNVGPRSMTVLAQFVESLQAEPYVSTVEHPTFTRVEDKNLGFLSPFHLKIALQ